VTEMPVAIHWRVETGERWRSPASLLKMGVLLLFLLIPVLFPSYKAIDLAVKIAVFAILVASFDIMLGYTGILSFGHAMFFGIGAYSVGLFIGKWGSPSYMNLALGFGVAIVLCLLLALVISFLSLRVKAIFFAMVTLAMGEFAIILASKLTHLTGGEDGVSLRIPGVFAKAFDLGSFLGVQVNGRIITYYFILLCCLGLFLLMLRFTHSPLGRVLQAIRDNVERAEALGYKTFIFQTVAICFGCVIAGLTGGLYAMWVGYVNPESCLGVMRIMLSVLLMVIIGGMGTLYGAIVGAAFMLIAETFLPDLQGMTRSLFPHAAGLHEAMERWLLVFGVLFIVVVFFFPKGIVGSLREYGLRRKWVRTG
jgi:branched-chain amino acid transport system permease protein